MYFNGRAANASNIRDEYIVIGRCLNYAIVKNEVGTLFFVDDESAVLTEGDLCTEEFLRPVNELPGIIREVVAMSFESGVA